MKIPIVSALLDDLAVGRAVRLDRNSQRIVEASIPRHELNQRNWFTRSEPREFAELIRLYTGWVYACASKNATTVAQIPLRLYASSPEGGLRKGATYKFLDRKQKRHLQGKAHLAQTIALGEDIVEITSHPWLDLMRKVNPFHNGFEMLELMQLYLELTGNAYWFVSRGTGGTPSEIWPLPSQHVNIRVDPSRHISHYEYGVEQDRLQRIETEECAHFKFPNPQSLWYGTGPMAAARLSGELNIKFNEYEHSMLDNNGVMPYVLETDDSLGTDVVNRLRQDLRRVHGGHRRAGKPGIFHSGLKVHTVATNPKDINYAVGQKMTKEQVAAVFGVPLSLLTTEDVNRSNAAEGNTSYMRYTILPRLNRNEQVINQDIIQEMYDEKLFVAYDNPIPDDVEFALRQQTEELNTHVRTINEVRGQQGMDHVEWGNEPLVQGDWHNLGDEPEPLPMIEVVDALPQIEEDEEGAEGQRRISSKQIPEDEYLRMEAMIAQWLAISKLVIVSNVNISTVMSANSLDIAIAWSEINAQGVSLVGPEMTAAANRGGSSGVQRLRRLRIVAPAWNVRNPRVTEWAEKRVGERITLITESTRAAIRDGIAEGLRSGASMRQLETEIRSQVGMNRPQMHRWRKLKASGASKDALVQFESKLLKERAEMIARTETSGAFAAGNIEAYKDSGIAKKELQLASDPCPRCSAISPKIYSIGDDTVTLPIHPRCRCNWMPIVE